MATTVHGALRIVHAFYPNRNTQRMSVKMSVIVVLFLTTVVLDYGFKYETESDSRQVANLRGVDTFSTTAASHATAVEFDTKCRNRMATCVHSAISPSSNPVHSAAFKV